MKKIGGIEDPASSGGYFGIAQPSYLVNEFLFPRARVADVGVRVAERGQHHSTSGIHDFPAIRLWDVTGRPATSGYRTFRHRTES